MSNVATSNLTVSPQGVEQGPTAQGIPSSVMLPLDQPRILGIKDGKFTYTFHFRRITQADWEKYFAGVHSSSRSEQKAQIQTLDLDTAGIDLVEDTVSQVDGYAGSFTSSPGWQKKILPRHSIPVSWLLRTAVPSASESEAPFDPDKIEVRLDAAWSWTQTNRKDEVTMFQGLVHYFSAPTPKQKQTYLRAISSSRVVGGSRFGTTIHPARHLKLLQLYDELILDVDGYSVGGQKVTKDAITREMDAYHKTQAALQLFMGAGPTEEQAEAA